MAGEAQRRHDEVRHRRGRRAQGSGGVLPPMKHVACHAWPRARRAIMVARNSQPPRAPRVPDHARPHPRSSTAHCWRAGAAVWPARRQATTFCWHASPTTSPSGWRSCGAAFRWRPTSARTTALVSRRIRGVAGVEHIIDVDATVELLRERSGPARRRRRGGAAVRRRLARSRRVGAVAAAGQRFAGRTGADPARVETGRAAARLAARRRDAEGAARGLDRGRGRDQRRRLAARRALRRRARHGRAAAARRLCVAGRRFRDSDRHVCQSPGADAGDQGHGRQQHAHARVAARR